MSRQKFKYKNAIEQTENCPPEDFEPIERLAFRWVHQIPRAADFLPLNVLKEPPPRVLDEADLHCMGFGLSFFDSYTNACGKFQSIYSRLREHLKNDFLNEKGGHISSFNLKKWHGVADLPAKNNVGHFTFHEFDGVNLLTEIAETRNG